MELDPAFGHWLAGFIDGEGSFSIRRSGRSLTPGFTIGVRADEFPTLKTIQTHTGIGSLYCGTKPQKHQTGYGSPAASWSVNSHNDLDKLVQILDTYPLRGKKRREYDIWRTAVIITRRRTIGRPKGGGTQHPVLHLRLEQLKRELHAARAYQSPNQDHTPLPDPQLAFPSNC